MIVQQCSGMIRCYAIKASIKLKWYECILRGKLYTDEIGKLQNNVTRNN